MNQNTLAKFMNGELAIPLPIEFHSGLSPCYLSPRSAKLLQDAGALLAIEHVRCQNPLSLVLYGLFAENMEPDPEVFRVGAVVLPTVHPMTGEPYTPNKLEENRRHEYVHAYRWATGCWSARRYKYNPVATVVEEYNAYRHGSGFSRRRALLLGWRTLLAMFGGNPVIDRP